MMGFSSESFVFKKILKEEQNCLRYNSFLCACHLFESNTDVNKKSACLVIILLSHKLVLKFDRPGECSPEQDCL